MIESDGDLTARDILDHRLSSIEWNIRKYVLGNGGSLKSITEQIKQLKRNYE